jgi:hypothetical protein
MYALNDQVITTAAYPAATIDEAGSARGGVCLMRCGIRIAPNGASHCFFEEK